jgi:hypothetical protein
MKKLGELVERIGLAERQAPAAAVKQSFPDNAGKAQSWMEANTE